MLTRTGFIFQKSYHGAPYFAWQKNNNS